MKTFTHILSVINWIDVAMLVLLIRIVFIGVKTGFVTELFKLFGVFIALFAGLHYYTPLAVFTTKKTNWSVDILQCVFFVLLVCLAVLLIKYLRDGFLMVFKFETTHAGVNQWGSGILSVVRAFLLVSLVLFGILLSRIEWLQKQTFTSISHRLALKAAPNTYGFVFNNFVGKVFTTEKFNDEVVSVVAHNNVSTKRF
jgi:uncharacterized membrane protein required for colicin V production